MNPRYAGAAGLTWGTAWLHIVQVLAVATGMLPYTNKILIAVAGSIVYSVATLLLDRQRRSGAWLIITMPAVGAIAVGLGWVLHWGIHPDVFNLAILMVQLPGIVLAGHILGFWGKKSTDTTG